MMLYNLYQAVDKLLEGRSQAQLAEHAGLMSERYRQGIPYDQKDRVTENRAPAPLMKAKLSDGRPILRELQSEMEYLAYLVVRQPATFAALQKVLFELKRQLVKPYFSSVLDVGSGPGTALWALSEHFQWESATAFELQSRWIDLAKKLWKEHPHAMPIEWQLADISSPSAFLSSGPRYDLVIASYCLNEVDKVQASIDALWSMTSQVLVWIEPGRSDCFEKMRAFRERVIASGEGEVLAPCTGQGRCPFSPKQEVEEDPDEVPLDDAAWHDLSERHVGPGWCHFSVRLERRALHRALKQASLSYEDEKFCYLIVARKGAFDLLEPALETHELKRIMEEPKVRSGHVKMALCDSEHMREEVVTKTDKPTFRLAKKANWGDLWPQLSMMGGVSHEDQTDT